MKGKNGELPTVISLLLASAFTLSNFIFANAPPQTRIVVLACNSSYLAIVLSEVVVILYSVTVNNTAPEFSDYKHTPTKTEKQETTPKCYADARRDITRRSCHFQKAPPDEEFTSSDLRITLPRFGVLLGKSVFMTPLRRLAL